MKKILLIALLLFSSLLASCKDNANNARPNNEYISKRTSLTYDAKLLSSYTTSLAGSSDERINNIKIVCNRLNNYILWPNETFSYNDVTGPFGPSDGFKEAPILLSNGEHADGYGGGVCQLSSTLYNVVKNIENIDIIEKHEHSAPVGYVPEGDDATVSLQSNLDFKFKNNTNYPIQFKSECDNSNLTVWAYQSNYSPNMANNHF